MGEKYKRGVPELGLPSLDPMSMPKIEIQMGNNKVKMEDITSSGFILKKNARVTTYPEIDSATWTKFSDQKNIRLFRTRSFIKNLSFFCEIELKLIPRDEQYQCYICELRQEHKADDDEHDLPGHGDEWEVHRGGAGQVQRALQEPFEEYACQECR